MTTRIGKESPKTGQELIGFCRESPFEVLMQSYGKFRIYSYCEMKEPFGDYSGLIIAKITNNIPGTSVTGTFGELGIKESLRETPFPRSYEKRTMLLAEVISKNLRSYHPFLNSDYSSVPLHPSRSLKIANEKGNIPKSLYDLARILLRKETIGFSDLESAVRAHSEDYFDPMSFRPLSA